MLSIWQKTVLVRSKGVSRSTINELVTKENCIKKNGSLQRTKKKTYRLTVCEDLYIFSHFI